MQSGITASQSLLSAFSTLVSTPSQRGLIATIDAESLVPVTTIESKSPSFTSDLTSLQAHLTKDTALYILLRTSPADNGFAAITYVPDHAPVRQKMLFASTRLTLIRSLGLDRFSETLFVTSPAELTAEGWAAHEAHGKLEAPLTEEERANQGMKEAEAVESGGTGARRIHMSDHFSLPVEGGVQEALKALGRGEGGNFVSLGIDMGTERLTLEAHEDVDIRDIAGRISEKEPRYSFYRYAVAGEEGKMGLLSISTCPENLKVKQRMVYASSRLHTVHMVEQESGLEVTRKIEVSDPSEISAESIEEEIAPKQQAEPTAKAGFARPRRPGRR